MVKDQKSCSKHVDGIPFPSLTLQSALVECAGFIKGAGGLCPMNCPGIENINLTSIIAGHFDYISKMEEILELVAIQFSP